MKREPKEKNEQRTYTIPKELVKKIQKEAQETERTESQMVRLILKKHYENKEEKK